MREPKQITVAEYAIALEYYSELEIIGWAAHVESILKQVKIDRVAGYRQHKAIQAVITLCANVAEFDEPSKHFAGLVLNLLKNMGVEIVQAQEPTAQSGKEEVEL